MELVLRKKYLDAALRFRDTDLIKVVTGIRRCGKSTLLLLVEQHLRDQGKVAAQFVSLNLESRKTIVENEEELYQYFKERLYEQGRTYIFIDEVQKIEGWENAVNAMRVDFDCDIYITGSNAKLLSSELSTYLSGRYVEIKMLPLVFSEYLDFCGLKQQVESKSIVVDEKNNPYLVGDIFDRYLRYGGMPRIAGLDTDQQSHSEYMASLYDSVIVRDVLGRDSRKKTPVIRDPDMLERLSNFLADSIGCLSSAKSISDSLSSGSNGITDKTVSSYIYELCLSYLFYPVRRYDIKGKNILKTLPKYYIVDVGIRSYMLGYRFRDYGRIFENVVFLQLIYYGYEVSVGKLYSKEVDFVAIKDGRQIYIQVADSMLDGTTESRELTPLHSIRDAYEKCVIVRQGRYPDEIEGIRIISAEEFLLEGI